MNLFLRFSGPAMLAALFLIPASSRAAPEEDSLSRIVNREIRADGPFFTASERALIERKCGYTPGQYDGFEANMSNGVFTCTNGRRVDDPEMRAMLHTAEPRISQRVHEVMRRPVITAAIHRETEQATARALREVRARPGN